MKPKIFILFYAFLCLYITSNRQADWKGTVLSWDASGYHLYLPAVFIYHDLGKLSFYHEIHEKYLAKNRMGDYYALFAKDNGKYLNKYAIGVSVLELPFFLIAHTYCLLNGAYPADGYSHPYEWGAAISIIFWVMAGLFILSSVLRKYYDDKTVLWVIACIGLGTNLYYYTAFFYGMSHPYSFFFFAALLYYTDKWYKAYKLRDICLLGITLGFIAIVRPSNLIIAIIPLFWKVYNYKSLQERIRLLLTKKTHLLVGLVLFCLVSLIQMGYWKYITGQWLYFSYENEGFNFLRPYQIAQGLFGYRKGWFVYTPIAFISFFGFIALWKKNKELVPVLLAFLFLTVWIVFSWRCWWYGAGFGSRATIESMAILAFPLGALLQKILHSAYLYRKLASITLLIILITLNIFQTYQYVLTIIPYDRVTRSYYWHVFGKLYTYPEYETLLMTDQEVDKETERTKQP